MRFFALVLIPVAALSVAGCWWDDDPDNEPDDLVPGEEFNDGEIANILFTINGLEVEQAEAAEPRLRQAEVSDFAAEIISAHEAEDDELRAIIEDSNIEVRETDSAATLRTMSQEFVSEIENASTLNVDATYLATQIDMHAGILAILEGGLMESANDDDLEDHLTQAKATARAHYDEAVGLITDLASGDPGTEDPQE